MSATNSFSTTRRRSIALPRRLLSTPVVLSLLVTSIAAGSRADNIVWPSGGATPYFKVAQNQPLGDVLREFAADQGVPITLSEKVQGTISGQFGPMPPQEFLSRITQSSGLVWYYDGHVIYVYRSDEMQSTMLQLGATSPAEILDKLTRLGVLDQQYPIKTLAENNLLYISGPPRYVEIVQKAVETIDASSQTRIRIEMAVEVFPLQNAWADDQAFFFNGQQVIIPGVATILRNLVTGQQSQGLANRLGPLPNFNLPSLRGQGLGFRQNLALAQSQQVAVNAQATAAAASAKVDAFEASRQQTEADSQAAVESAVQPIIQADPRLNAVVIRDVRTRMEYFRKVIKDLDQPSGLVQIEANIIDVNANAGFQFGAPYGVQWQDDVNDNREVEASLNATDVPNLTLRFTENGVNQLLVQLRALETDGRARFIARPSVLTLNNTEAHLDSTQTFFVRVAGTDEVDLFDVTVGTMLRIVPHIICESTGRRVKLITRIEDGRATDATVDAIPIINRNTINTQAVLNEGESLLIGGLIREEVTKVESRVPILGRLPAVGMLFSSVDSQKDKFERVVLIRPRIIDLPCPGGAQTGLQGLPFVGEGMITDPIPYAGVPDVILAPGEELVQPVETGPSMAPGMPLSETLENLPPPESHPQPPLVQ